MRQKTIEEYIEIIYVLQKKRGRARTMDIASKKGVKPPSITEILKKMKAEGFVEYETYAGVTLTPSGEKIARKLMKKHKILADFFEIIGINRELAEVDGCEIEHHISADTIKQLEKFIKFLSSSDKKWIKDFEEFCKDGKREKGRKMGKKEMI